MTETMPSRPRRTAPVDAVCRDAVDEARAAILELVPDDHVGEHLGVVAEDDRVVTHRFVSQAPGYRGWQWAVTVARAPRARVVTIDEIAMLPGSDALVAPEWVPWSRRVEPGDLGVGDVLPTTDDDPRLSPGWSGLDDLAAASDEPGLRPSGWELGIGRRRVLSPEGRDDATSRWLAGDTGPGTPMARSAPGSCGTCGFLLPIGGPTGSAFGVCANGMSPADGRVVALTFGCGAHSEAAPEQPRT
ncbi:MAG TPA: DUF3027 domain-containing protein [Motilibacterales bacterium]|nr:DUF3027 domain-containing protein [Motilibacterales bacterium]